jgi:HEPN domain-containing protein
LIAERKTIANALRLAAGCLRDARLLSASGSRNAAYLAEQGVEQVVRAIATSENIHIERHDAHQLDKFVRRLPATHPEKAALGALVWLEAYATTFRYTAPSGRIPPAPETSKLNEAIVHASSLVERVAVHFGVNLEDESPANSTKPMQS